MGDLSATPSVVSACWSDLPFGHRGPIPQRAPAPARRELRRTRRPRTLTRLSRTESPRRTRLGLVGHGAPLRPPEEECCRSVSDFSDYVGWLFFRERISPRLADRSPVAHGGPSCRRPLETRSSDFCTWPFFRGRASSVSGGRVPRSPRRAVLPAPAARPVLGLLDKCRGGSHGVGRRPPWVTGGLPQCPRSWYPGL